MPMLNDHEIELIRHARHGDPFAVLGPHPEPDGRIVLRAFLPGATHVVAIDPATGAFRANISNQDHPGDKPGSW